MLRSLARSLRSARRLGHGGHSHEHERYQRGIIPELPQLLLLTESQRREWHYPLDQPDWRAADAADYMQDDDTVLGLYFQGSAWAIPWWVMKNYHVANLTLADTPLLVTLCELCSSAAALDPVIDGKRHTFRLKGIYNGTHVIGDYETDSIWSSFSGEALHGAHKGFVMERLPLYQCFWPEWRTLHPESVVAYASPEARLGHGEEHRPGSGQMSSGIRTSLVRPLDQRLVMNSLVLGVHVDGSSKAYPLERLDA
ncbi:MAG: DUF3179 domain-containing protein, partial [Actinobacteria bacterium]|nr:DUF3179 domain-containing protein [Actinomycetota bacterium]